MQSEKGKGFAFVLNINCLKAISPTPSLVPIPFIPSTCLSSSFSKSPANSLQASSLIPSPAPSKVNENKKVLVVEV